MRRILGEEASPLVEESLLIGLAIAIFVVIALIVKDILSQLQSAAESLKQALLV